jgi:hypothetical protein
MTGAEAARLQAEVAKLGANGPARVAAVETYLRAQAGEGAEEIIGSLRTARQIESFEKIMAANRQRAIEPSTPPSPAPAPDGRVDEATYARMSHAERIEYTRRFNGGAR